ncbi:MAG: ribbon-helix-helix domain-containing protein [Metallosphaera sp.]
MKSRRLRAVTVYLPITYIEILDKLVKKKFYSNRSDAIRSAVRDLVMKESKLLQE